MHRTRIKFCGITRPQDAIAAAAAGADAIGLIFYARSSRHVSIEQARAIVQSLPPMVTPVALFVNADPQQVRSIAASINVRTIQLHGNETPDQLAGFADFAVIKAVHCDEHSLPAILETWNRAAEKWKNLAGLLLETAHPTQPGGTGIENNWAAIEETIESHRSNLPLIAAGGLNPENVDDVVRRLKPWAVDVSTGIEETPGIKSIEKMRRFTQQVYTVI